MKLMVRSVLALVVLGLLPLSSRAADRAPLAWMEGRWTGTRDGVETEEYWTSNAGGTMLGLHKDVKGGRMVSFEFLRIAPGEGDTITYFASPHSEPPTPFRRIESGERRIVFENKEHDFPQRILYWLDAKGALHARIEGTMNGKPASEEWTWTKAGS
jgi:hypothetical protein